MDLDELRAKAEAATPGPWRHVGSLGRGGGDAFIRRGESGPALASNLRNPDAAFIAAASPSVVVALIDAVEVARETLRSLLPSIHPQDAVTMRCSEALARLDALLPAPDREATDGD